MNETDDTNGIAECAYCGYEAPYENIVPPADDDEAWSALAEDHADDCEWIETRAHRQRNQEGGE